MGLLTLPMVLIGVQIMFIVLFGVFVRYDDFPTLRLTRDPHDDNSSLATPSTDDAKLGSADQNYTDQLIVPRESEFEEIVKDQYGGWS